MTSEEQFHCVLWLVSIASHAALLWFCQQYGFYDVRTGQALGVACLATLVTILATLISFVSFTDAGSLVRDFFATAVPLATLILALVDHRRTSYLGIYAFGVAFFLLASYLFIDFCFPRRRLSLGPGSDEDDDDGSAGILHGQNP